MRVTICLRAIINTDQGVYRIEARIVVWLPTLKWSLLIPPILIHANALEMNYCCK